ncbi:MAG: antitoxin [Thermodesulfovibrio sp.]|nr:antitoxin [Thermodesulfovibrio sp.]
MIDRITVNPAILGGKPIVKGTRISVEFILELLASGVTEDEILRDYTHLKKEDIHACLEYAARALKNEIIVELEPAAA